MRGLIGKILGYFGSSQELHIKRNVITYGVCVIIATVLWFLNALNKEYTTEISYPIKYTELPKGKLLVSEPPKEMTLTIKAHGFAPLQHQHLLLTHRPQRKLVVGQKRPAGIHHKHVRDKRPHHHPIEHRHTANIHQTGEHHI